MARRGEFRKVTERPSVRNPTLYSLLRARFGKVIVSNEGEPPQWGTPRYSHARRRNESVLHHEGEYYRIACPYCNDTTQRLFVNHMWPANDPVSGAPMGHLAHCFHEDCLKEHYADFVERVFGMMSAAEREKVRQLHTVAAVEADVELEPLGPVPLPGLVVPLTSLQDDHRAVRYLRDRGFDVDGLVDSWDVGWCVRSSGMHSGIAQRIFVPISFRGEMVGWQGRWPADDWKKQGAQKYYNLAGFRKSLVLYNHDAALAFPYVIVQEGVTDVWATGDGSVSTLGKTPSPHQRELLRQWAKKTDPGGLLVLMYDPEAWTTEQKNREAAAIKHATLLAELRDTFDDRVVEIELPPGRDPGSFDRDTLRKLVKSQVKAAGFSPRRYDL